jgi:hypothetical protein
MPGGTPVTRIIELIIWLPDQAEPLKYSEQEIVGAGLDAR